MAWHSGHGWSHQPPYDHDDDSRQEDQNGYLVNAVHHAEVEICLLVGVGFLEYPQEVIPHLAHLKELFNSICHNIYIASLKQLREGLGLAKPE